MVADEVAERLLEALGRSLLPRALQLVTEHSGSARWQYRRSVQGLLSRATDGCSKALKQHLNEVTAALVAGMQDLHPRVRFQAITGIARLADTYSGEFQSRSCQQVNSRP